MCQSVFGEGLIDVVYNLEKLSQFITQMKVLPAVWQKLVYFFYNVFQLPEDLSLFRTMTTEIVDVIYVNNVIWTMGCEKGERGKSQEAGKLLADQRQGWMGIRHHEQRSQLFK
jgi:hypothetical protein